MAAVPLAAVDVSGAVTDGVRTVTTFVPKLLGFLVILLVGFFLAKAIAKIVDKLLERTGFDQAVERGGIRRALAKSQYDASDIVAKLVFYAIFIPVLSAAIGTLGIDALTQPLAAFIALIPKILVALVLVVIGAALATALKSIVTNTLGGLSYGPALGAAAGALVMVLFAKAALDEVGIATTVTTAILYTVLAIVAGVAIVGIGGGLVRPMQDRWGGILDRAADQTEQIRQAQQAQYGRGTAATSAYPTEARLAAPTEAAATVRPPRR